VYPGNWYTSLMKEIEITYPIAENASEINELMYLASVDSYKRQGANDQDIEMIFGLRQSKEAFDHTRKMIENLSVDEKYLVAKSGTMIVGVCYGQKEIDQNTLHAIYILPNFQGKGIGTLLWNSIKNWFDDKAIYLKVFDNNTKAISFYEKLGFEKTGKSITTIGFGDSLSSDIEMVFKKK
jgi:ribosomal protein S18 acetylase RimI-like enzyme